ncbi:MAG: aldehyde dehydrogenase family protein [Acidimicrobiaceae bacterium]|nr:aldehyde dehydrogenase family protein [Acidimicrobiaceae bacterium]MYA74187.1 aldehyde dehydrogenase family protein [Acidimicrobiaceae bacterium]MYC42481.1 aldehyde dehydrogenase family protein [Acidimicrobiaceae bacterium]MYG55215.1 aldehyde dehydrogenase family protein [Acidimicrobiaceae bacterium]MYH87274.1 aldehyde dehydrogenase family protein [Acidimicrobiaceae bacterium]
MSFWNQENQLLIDGELVGATGDRRFTSLNPATEETIGEAADATVVDVERAIRAARRAFDETDWSTNAGLRARCMRQLAQGMRDNVEDLRTLTVSEVGVPIAMTSGPALEGPIGILDYYADLAESYDRTVDLGVAEAYGGMHRRWVEREPYGVVSAISAYNYPTQLNLAKLGPALAAGCTVVLKGAPDTPLITLALGRLIAGTDMPAGVVNVLASSEVETGVVMTTDPDVDMVTFTGSTAVGKSIVAAASSTLKKVFLELGGKSAMVVLDEENVDGGAFGCSMAANSHAGQGCAITSRLLVPRAHMDRAVKMATEIFEGLGVGDPFDPANYVGPLISAKQREKVQGMVDRAVEAGATLVTGGSVTKHAEGFFFQPTVIVDADENSEIAQDEVFGPVLVVLPHDGDDDAVRIANNSKYGLSGGVLATDRARALGVARRIRTGTLSVNGGMWHAPDAPFGGYKQSGIGRENGVAGLEEFLQTKLLAEPA